MTLTVLASDGSQDTQTITREAWEKERARADAVHVVRPQAHTGGDD